MDEPLVPQLEKRPKDLCDRCCPYIQICAGSLTIILVVSLLVFDIFPHRDPEFVVSKFYVPSLDLSTIANSSTISFDLQIWNENQKTAIQYYDIDVSLHYGNGSSFSVANVSIPGFYQYYNFYRGSLEKVTVTATGMPWENAKQEVISNGTTSFHMNLKARFKYSKLMIGWTKSYFVDVGGNIKVNKKGSMAISKWSRGVELS